MVSLKSALIPTVLVGVALAVAAAAQPDQQEQATSTLSGKVVSIDAKAGTFTLRSATDETAVFLVDADTTIMSGSQKVALADLHQGEWLAVDGDRKAGQRHATYVEVVENPGAGNGGTAAEPTPGGAQIEVAHNRLSPSLVQIAPGETVTFKNVAKMPGGHTVVADDGSFASPPLDLNQTWSHSFDVPGVYGVHIQQHPGAKASIVVQ
jgi:plastocyanin